MGIEETYEGFDDALAGVNNRGSSMASLVVQLRRGCSQELFEMLGVAFPLLV